MKRSNLAAAALAGTATGLRSTIGVGALVETASGGLPIPLRTPPARITAGLATLGELVVDKLPKTPSRLAPPGLAARVALAAASGVLIARAAGQPVIPAALVAAAAAVASARVGHDLRALASTRVPPFAAAVTEDVVAIGLAALAARA